MDWTHQISYVSCIGREIFYHWSESESCSAVFNSLRLHGLYSPWNSLGQNTGVGSLYLLQRFFITQGSNPDLLHCRWILYHLSHKRSPRIPQWVAYPFSSRISQSRNWTGVFCIAGGFFTNWTISTSTTWKVLIKYVISNICSQAVPSHFIFLIVSFAVNIFNLGVVPFYLFFFSRNLCYPWSQIFYLIFSRCFIVLDLTLSLIF